MKKWKVKKFLNEFGLAALWLVVLVSLILLMVLYYE